jgi:hypothetical protein
MNPQDGREIQIIDSYEDGCAGCGSTELNMRYAVKDYDREREEARELCRAVCNTCRTELQWYNYDNV